MSEENIDFCVCVEESGKVIGVFTDGDFRRAVYSEILLDDNIDKWLNKNFRYVNIDYANEEVNIEAQILHVNYHLVNDGMVAPVLAENVDEFKDMDLIPTGISVQVFDYLFLEEVNLTYMELVYYKDYHHLPLKMTARSGDINQVLFEINNRQIMYENLSSEMAQNIVEQIILGKNELE